MILSLQDLQAEAAATGFLPETLDKVIRLLSLLEAFRSHPFLRDRLALKGGTALNLFVFDLPRLSVDIDLNYIASADRDVMLAEREKVRVGFVVYGACSRVDWRTLSPADIRCDQREFQQQLIPVLRGDAAPPSEGINVWMERLVSECRDRLSLVLPFEQHEREFLDRVLDRGEIVPELLTEDHELARRIRQHPQLLWKVKNVRQHKGLPH